MFERRCHFTIMTASSRHPKGGQMHVYGVEVGGLIDNRKSGDRSLWA